MADDIWTVRRILDWIEGYLRDHGDDNPRLSAQWLVSEALGMSRMELYLDMDRPLNADERARLRDYTRRRGAGEPLQYITGHVGFRYITVKVAPGVLIPRPETEVLVSEALALLPAPPKPQDAIDAELERIGASLEEGMTLEEALAADAGAEAPEAPRELHVADICTGSGCIACSMASEHPQVRVVATDLEPRAVALARENAAALGLDERVDVVQCDLGEGVPDDLLGAFDLVVSNPPYVPTAVLAELDREVADYEPALALDGGPDGLDVFRRLLSWCDGALSPNGAFAFELHETCLDAARDHAETAGYVDVRVVNDLAGKPRVLTGRRGDEA